MTTFLLVMAEDKREERAEWKRHKRKSVEENENPKQKLRRSQRRHKRTPKIKLKRNRQTEKTNERRSRRRMRRQQPNKKQETDIAESSTAKAPNGSQDEAEATAGWRRRLEWQTPERDRKRNTRERQRPQKERAAGNVTDALTGTHQCRKWRHH